MIPLGLVWITNSLVTISSLLHGSQWQLPEQYSDMLGSWVENAYLPLVYKGAFMDMARGREITRVTDHSTGRSILMSAYKVAKIAKPEVRDRVMGIVKYNILADTLCDFVATAVPTELIPEVRAFLADSTIAAVDPAPYYKQFAMMDREVFAAPRFALGLALSSSRIQNYETLDSENKGAWHTGDGMTYIYNGDLAQYGDDYWYTVNRYRLPGITVDAQQTHKVQNYEFGKGVLYVDGYKSPHAWVGGASLADCGMAGMWFKDELSTLEAKKSWLMAGEEVVALGAGINIILNMTLIPNFGVQGGVVATLAGYLVVFTVRIIDTRRIVPLHWHPFKLLLNLALLGVQTYILLTFETGWLLPEIGLCLVVTALNFRLLLQNVQRLLMRRRS